MPKILLITLLSFSLTLNAQDNLMDLFNEGETTNYTYATFKTTRIINSQSIENPAGKNLLFIVSHQFGRLNEGAYELFGLDKATMRLGFEYGVTDWLAVGIGRSTLNKTYDGSVKLKLLRQSSGLKNMPFSLTYYTNMALNSLKWAEPERKNYFSSRLQYLHQLLIARKFNKNFSLQLMPSLIHRNLVEKASDQNDVFALGAGGRYKITNRMSVNVEYFYLLPGETADQFENSFSVGVDIETGGHVFQLYLTNSQGMVEEYFITNTTGNWFDGDIHFGFNINRTFAF
jgi:opacity protein-like surface antigen